MLRGFQVEFTGMNSPCFLGVKFVSQITIAALIYYSLNIVICLPKSLKGFVWFFFFNYLFQYVKSYCHGLERNPFDGLFLCPMTNSASREAIIYT